MKFIAAAALVSAFLFTGINAHAEDAAPASTATSIGAGHWQIAGSASLYGLGKDYTQLYIGPKAEYFVCDHLSVGGQIGLNFYKDVYANDPDFALRQTVVGPSATMYFSRSTVAPYVSQAVLLQIPKSGESLLGGQTGVGVGFFVNEHISIAPEFDVTYQKDSVGANQIVVQIATYL